MNIKELVKEAHAIALSKGHWIDKTDGDCIALMHSELSEALEELRYNEPNDKVAEEFADCVIRIADYCGAKGLDLDEAIVKKMEFNKGREWKHGKRF